MPTKNIAIITGASGGLGKEFVALLACDTQIEEIWALARSQEKLLEIQNKYGHKIRPVLIDLSSRQELLNFSALLQSQAHSISWLINNAGYGKFGLWKASTAEESLNMVDLNAAAVVGLTLLCLPHMQKGGHILNIASIAAFQPLPYLNLYSATKAFIHHYSSALNRELRGSGITVTSVCPGWMDTAFVSRASSEAQQTVQRYQAQTPPGPVARKALKDAKKGRSFSTYGWYAKGCHVAAKLLPQQLMMHIWLKQQGL